MKTYPLFIVLACAWLSSVVALECPNILFLLSIDDLLEPSVTYQMAFIQADQEVFLKVANEEKNRYFHMANEQYPNVTSAEPGCGRCLQSGDVIRTLNSASLTIPESSKIFYLLVADAKPAGSLAYDLVAIGVLPTANGQLGNNCAILTRNGVVTELSIHVKLAAERS